MGNFAVDCKLDVKGCKKAKLRLKYVNLKVKAGFA